MKVKDLIASLKLLKEKSDAEVVIFTENGITNIKGIKPLTNDYVGLITEDILYIDEEDD